MWERLKKEEETRLGRPLNSDEMAAAVFTKVGWVKGTDGGQKALKRAIRKAIRYGV